MKDQLEDELRLLFLEDADGAPTPVSLLDQAMSRALHQRRRARLRWGSASLVAAAAAGLTAVVLNGSLHLGSNDRTGTSAEVVSGHGALPEGGQASCAKEYSPSEVAKRAFAFSGTVRSIAPSRTNRPGVELNLVSATFAVDHWFKGGPGEVVTVDIVDPSPPTPASEDPSPSFGLGTRLLVSGAHRWDEATADDLLAWSCGFTRYYDQATSSAWRAVMR